MTREDLQARLTELEAKAARAEKEIDSIVERYGTGCRPSFVSADIGFAKMYRKQYLAEAAKIRKRLEALEKEEAA